MAARMLRQSERALFKKCPQCWYWAYVEGLAPRTQDTGARWFGTGIHLALAEWYVPGKERGRDPIETWNEFAEDTFNTIPVYRDGDPEAKADFVDARELGENMLAHYLEEYGLDEAWEVIATEQRFRVPVPDLRSTAKRTPTAATAVGTFDLVIRDHADEGRIKIVDHKTAAAIKTNHLTLDDQAGTYLALGTTALRRKKLIGPDERVHSMVFNFMRKAKRDERPKNDRGVYLNKPKKEHYLAAFEAQGAVPPVAGGKQFPKMTLAELADFAVSNGITVEGEESKTQPPAFFLRETVKRTGRENRDQIERIGQESKVMKAMASGRIPLISAHNQSCVYGDFAELHEAKQARAGNLQEIKDMAFKEVDPYADHRTGAGNSKTSVKADRELRVK